MRFCKVLVTILKKFSQIFASIIILFFIFIPIFIILLPIYIYRYIISKWSSLFIQSHGKILTAISSMFAVDNMTVDPTCTILLTLSLQDTVSVQEVSRRVQGLLNTGRYPELKQSLTQWMGFFFWKFDPSFCLDDHVISINKPMGDEDIEKLKDVLLKKPYKKDKPLWDMTIITNYTGNNQNAKSVCFNRFHHSLVDGFSLYKLNSQLSDYPEKWVNDAPKYPKNGCIRNVLINLNLILFGPFELVSSMITTFERNEWKLKPGSSAKDGFLVETDKTTFQELKYISKIQGVSVTALLFASYTGAIRRMILKYGIGQVPDTVTVICPFPMPGHPEKLRVHVTMAPIQAPVGTADPILRLQFLQRQLGKLKTSTLPLTYHYCVKLLGGLFPCMIKLLSKGNGMGTGIMTNFPGPKHYVDVFGSKLSGLSVRAGVAHGSQTSGCAFVSYGGQMCITTGFDKSLFSEKEKASEFLTFILDEFDILKDCKKSDSVILQTL